MRSALIRNEEEITQCLFGIEKALAPRVSDSSSDIDK